jgi:two-component system, OmpR family, response regulator
MVCFARRRCARCGSTRDEMDLMTAGSSIAVVDDDASLLGILAAALRHHGFSVTTYTNGPDVISAVTSGTDCPLVIVMDVMLPGVDGIESCTLLRKAGIQTPVLFLSALGAPVDRVRGLTNGGDDYLTKPFDLDELVARVNILTKRSAHSSTNSDSSSVRRFADLELDDDAHRVTRGSQQIELTSTEYRLLRYLLDNSERVVSKTQILNAVWEYDFDGDVSVVETYIYYLRRKIDTVEPKLIQTVRGAGYSLRRATP